MGSKPSPDVIQEEIIINDNNEPNNAIAQEQKQPLIPENEKKDVEFKIFVGIDFGTDGCGLAYAVKNNPNPNNEYENKLNLDKDNDMDHVEIHTNFKDASDKWGKSRTSVLLDSRNALQCVGGEAATMYASMQNTQGWKLFERFKMNLYESPKWKTKILAIAKKQNITKVNLKDKIIPTNGGEPFPSKDIFVHELARLRELALDFIRVLYNQKKLITFKYNAETDIQWILTVPAIWSDFAKNKMQEWAQDAKLIDTRIRNQLRIVYEPDCASLSVQYACNKWISSGISIPIDYNPVPKNTSKKPKTNLVQFTTDSDEDADIDYGNMGIVNIDRETSQTVETVETKEESKYDEFNERRVDVMEENKYNDFTDYKFDEEMKYTAKTYTEYLEQCIYKLEEKVDPKIRFNPGDIYCLVDSGGGTCDIACHRTMGKYSTEEILHPTGGHWGSMNIDKQFEKLLELVFGESVIKEFRESVPGMWLQLTKNFCDKSKASFYNGNNSTKSYHHITLPSNFSKFINQQYEDEIDRVNEQLKNKSIEIFERNDMLEWKLGKWNDITLMIHNKVFIDFLFEPESVTPIIEHLKNVLSKMEMQKCQYIILVGGLANSRYYQQRMYNEFGRNGKMKIIVPDKPQLCVVAGAARMGINPHYIKSRKLPKTYGIRIDYAKESLPDIDEFDQDFLIENTYSCDKTKKDYVKNIFSIFVSNDKTIKFDDKPIVKSYFRRHPGQKTIDVKIFSSTKGNPLHVMERESEEIGQIQLLFNTSKKNKTKELEIIVEFYFNDTTLKVYAYPKNEEQMRQEYGINYLEYNSDNELEKALI